MLKKFLKKIFSVYNQNNHKVWCILGIKISFKRKKDIQDIKNMFQSLLQKTEEQNIKINKLENIIIASNDITKIPSAKGNLKLIQDCSISILNYFDSLCQKHNIQYWLDAGTLLGKVRHDGFIPWDDDIDIAVTRDEYNKLLSILDKEFCESGFHFVKSEIIRLYYKDTPGQVDIFPMDTGNQEIPLDGYQKEKFINNLNKIRELIVCDWNLLAEQKAICSEEDTKLALSKSEMLFEGQQRIKNGFVFYGIETLCDPNFQCEYTNIFPLKATTFYNINCFIPNDSNRYLLLEFGDYMTFPPDPFPKHEDIVNRLNSKTYVNCLELIKKYYPMSSQ